jgi:hypothetical protein
MKKSLFIFFLFSSNFLFSQDSYVTLNDQIVHGKIEQYKESSKNPKTVLFKDSVSGSSIYLTPANCKSFTVGLSDKFISYNGTRILNTDNAINSHLMQSAQLEKDNIQVFLRQIYQFQNYSVYKLFDDKRTNFYLSNNGVITELEYYENVNGNQVIPYYGYKNYLLNEFSDKTIKNLQHKVEILRYEENDLLNFFTNIFNDKSNSSEKLRNKYSNEILVGIGVNENFGTVTNFGNATYNKTSTSPSFEIALRSYSQRNFGRIFFQPSISVMPLSHTFNEGSIFKTKATLVNVNLGVGYIFLKKSNISIYGVAAGGVPIIFNYKTLKGTNGEYINSGSPDVRFTFHPEMGLIIKRSLNISVAGTLPFKLDFLSDPSFNYKVSQVSVVLRYAFIGGGKKK